MKCPNCGNEITGKFCTSCGTPAPVEEPVKEQETQTQPAQSDNFAANNYNSEPAQQNVADNNSQSNSFGADNYNTQPNNFGTDNFNAQPNNFGTDNSNAQPNNFGANNYNSQPVDYSGASTPSNGMPVNNGYTGQQFTNVPNNNMPNQPKKGMSGGKIAAIVISVILGIILIIGIIISAVACHAYKSFESGLKDNISALVSDYNDESSYYNWETSDGDSDVSKVTDNDGEIYDESTCCFYKVFNGNEVSVTGVNMYDVVDGDYTTKHIEFTLPSEIEGKKVTDIYNAYIYNPTNNDDKDVEIKVTVPGSVKTIQAYAFLNCESLTELVLEDGVTELENEAIVECENLKKITVPESTTTLGEYAFGFLSSDGMSYDYTPAKDLVVVAKKNSVAEQFAKENNFKVENN